MAQSGKKGGGAGARDGSSIAKTKVQQAKVKRTTPGKVVQGPGKGRREAEKVTFTQLSKVGSVDDDITVLLLLIWTPELRPL